MDRRIVVGLWRAEVNRVQNQLPVARKILLQSQKDALSLPADAGVLADIERRLARVEIDRREPEAARKHLMNAIASLADLHDRDAAIARAVIDLDLSKVALALDDRDEARRLAKQGVLAVQALGHDHSSDGLDAWLNLAIVELEALEFDTAQERLERLAQTLRALDRDNSLSLADVHYWLGELALRKGCYAEALTQTVRAETGYRAHLGENHRSIAHAVMRRGIILDRLGRLREALAASDLALAIDARAQDGAVESRVMYRIERIRILGQLGRTEEGVRAARSVVEDVRSDDFGPHVRALGQIVLGQALLRHGDHLGAVALLERGIDELAEIAGGDHVDMPPGLQMLASIYQRLGETGVAWRHAERAHRILQERRAPRDRLLPVIEMMRQLEGDGAAQHRLASARTPVIPTLTPCVQR